MKPEDFDDREVADSMKAASARLGVSLDLVKECKRRGCVGFRGSRVYLRPLAEMIANGKTETDTILFPVPTGPKASAQTISDFRELLRVAIRCGWLPVSELLEIVLEKVIERLVGSSRAAISARPKREAETFDKLTVGIHQGLGLVSALLEDGAATNQFLRRSGAAFERARKRLFQSDPARRACK